ncbi:MAG TPA: cyclodeaminase/cyclohydrolase family protein [Ktedonobacterales bacterium]|nr:cyclodeaminase/cyclohydrolase family protein [Ktedonobacterales bacterium]
MAGEQTIGDFLEALGSSAPAPGGGAASALAGALAAALAEMVAQLTVGRPRFAAVEEPMRTLIAEARAARADLLVLADDDARAYAAVSAAYKLPKATDEEKGRRDDAIQTALRDAMQPPLRMMAIDCRVLALAEEAAASGNPTVASDAGCAALLGEAAVRAAGLNVLANVVLLHDEAAATEARAAKERHEEQAAALRERTMAAVHARMGG